MDVDPIESRDGLGRVTARTALLVQAPQSIEQLIVVRQVVGRFLETFVHESIVVRCVGVHPHRQTQSFVLAQRHAFRMRSLGERRE